MKAPFPLAILLYLSLLIYESSAFKTFYRTISLSQVFNRIEYGSYRISATKFEHELDDINSNDVSYLEIIPNVVSMPETAVDHLDIDNVIEDKFAAIFTQCAPYIAMHRGTIIVVHIASQIMLNRDLFDAIMDDISILHLLGVQIILVAGIRDQLDERIRAKGKGPNAFHDGMRITDEDTLNLLKEVSGLARFEIESSLARGFRGFTTQSGISVISGNFFYTAKPLGVRDGIDFKLTGEVRKIETDNFKKRLDAGDVVLLTSLGYSNSGEMFNVPSESLAAECARKLSAAKLLYFTEGETIIDSRTGLAVQSLRLSQAIAMLDKWHIDKKDYNQIEEEAIIATAVEDDCLSTAGLEVENSCPTSKSVISPSFSRCIHLITRCVYALEGGVKRAHLIPPQRGAILKELYTRDGAGILISRDVYEGIRQAQPADLRAVEEIIRPLEVEGILVKRSREQLEKDMHDCYVLTRDGCTLACGMLKVYGDSHAEICCLAVHPNYRRGGRGETMLAYLERRAITLGINNVFVLSTRTMQWFEERGFVLSDPALLPPTRKYDKSRGSKVYIKKLGSQRDVDAEELLWNVLDS